MSQPNGTPVRYPAANGQAIAVRKPRRHPSQDVRPYGDRQAFTARARQLVEVARATVQTEMASEQSVRDFCETINYGASKKVMDRTCIALKAELLRLVTPEVTVVHELIRKYAKDEAELQVKVNAYDAAGEADSLTVLERLVCAVEAVLPLHEEHRAMIVRRLGGFMPSHTEGEVLG